MLFMCAQHMYLFIIEIIVFLCFLTVLEHELSLIRVYLLSNKIFDKIYFA